MISLARLCALAALPFMLAAAGCAADDAAETEAEDGQADALEQGTNRDVWVYNGALPRLDSPSIVVSQQAHTVRITGFLPTSYDAAQLPYFAKALDKDGKKQVTIVYPIATGSSVNHQPDEYLTQRVYPRRSDSSAPWGGFPFISYVRDLGNARDGYQGIAFHGPITGDGAEWRLKRGPVSHGCNRMQGEHVVELAHLIGVDLTTKRWTGADEIIRDINVPVKVIRNAPDTYEGQNVDSDYPALRGVKVPTTNVVKFPAWSSNDFPTWVCRWRGEAGDGPVPADYCKTVRGLSNRKDALTGR
jgi:hypothetical protein